MQELVDKIKEFTIDGSPSVGQWIQLGELAKKSGVKKFEMEKMVAEALKKKVATTVSEESKEIVPENLDSEENLIDITDPFEYKREATFNRPNLEFDRDKFEREMMSRRVQEDKMFDRDEEEETEIEQPEVVFPELNVTFDQPVDQVEPPKAEEEPIVEVPINPIEQTVDPPKQEAYKANEIPEMEFNIEPSDSNIEFEDISKTSFEEDPVAFETTVEYDNIADYIAASNKKAVEEAEQRAEDNKEKEEQESREKKRAKERQAERKQQREYSQRKSSMVTHAEAKRARTVGIVALIAGLVFGFIGIFVGLYGLNSSNKLKKEIDESSNLYGDQIKQNVSLGRGLSIAGIVIGSLRLFNSFSDLFL
ncbi:DUF4190 domain-containing protein [Parvicella tangerina]|uniref:Uncharacterized protein n=1 Tax=Parvicella tangerina TaxID=2829795 RepID=A0A916NPK9_9FLAO|nr:hypothetical protein [Parvicella tangerina]CAG5076929.1 hypothetical protein CRYO30217_00247 [Parvicella tangerina]